MKTIIFPGRTKKSIDRDDLCEGIHAREELWMKYLKKTTDNEEESRTRGRLAELRWLYDKYCAEDLNHDHEKKK